jgi:hypothetical protein
MPLARAAKRLKRLKTAMGRALGTISAGAAPAWIGGDMLTVYAISAAALLLISRIWAAFRQSVSGKFDCLLAHYPRVIWRRAKSDAETAHNNIATIWRRLRGSLTDHKKFIIAKPLLPKRRAVRLAARANRDNRRYAERTEENKARAAGCNLVAILSLESSACVRAEFVWLILAPIAFLFAAMRPPSEGCHVARPVP